MPVTVEPLAPREESVNSLGENTLEKIEEYLEKVRQRKEEAMQQLLSWANETEHNPAPAIFPELEISHIQEQIPLIEERSENIITALETHADLMRRIEEDLPPIEPPMGVQQGAGGDVQPNYIYEGRHIPLAALSNPPPERPPLGDIRQEQEAPHTLRTKR